MTSVYGWRVAMWPDVPPLTTMLKIAAQEQGAGDEFDPRHAERHIVEKLSSGVVIVLEADGEIVGAVTLSRVDLGYRHDDALETTHTFLLPRVRSMQAMKALFQGVEAYADQSGVVVMFHQLWYRQAIRNEAMDDGRFDAFYSFLGYREAGTSFARHPYRKVGRSYIYVPGMEKVRRRGTGTRRPSVADGANGAGETE